MGADPVFLVGGAVRDWLLGRTPHEYDFAFAASEELFVQRNPSAHKVGKSAGVFLLHGREYMPLRGSEPTEDLRKRLARDLACRDLTINALALASNGVLHSHPLALADLEAGVLRPASDSSFADDPARVFRAIRLACELPDFSLHPEALAQIRAVTASDGLAGLASERVGRECLKAFTAPKPSRWLGLMAESGCLAPWFAELNAAARIPAGPAPYHTDSVLDHTMAVMDAVAGDPLRVWMAFCHDLGKLLTDPELLPHHYGHEQRGAELAAALAARLGLSTRYRRAGELCALLHMKGGSYATLRPGTRCDLLLHVHAPGLDEPFWRVVEADSGCALRERVEADLASILAVTLPEKWRNLGEESGQRLREERCRALSLSRS